MSDVDYIQAGFADLHNELMRESAMYRACYELKLTGLMIDLQIREIERRGRSSHRFESCPLS